MLARGILGGFARTITRSAHSSTEPRHSLDSRIHRPKHCTHGAPQPGRTRGGRAWTTFAGSIDRRRARGRATSARDRRCLRPRAEREYSSSATWPGELLASSARRDLADRRTRTPMPLGTLRLGWPRLESSTGPQQRGRDWTYIRRQ